VYFKNRSVLVLMNFLGKDWSAMFFFRLPSKNCEFYWNRIANNVCENQGLILVLFCQIWHRKKDYGLKAC